MWLAISKTICRNEATQEMARDVSVALGETWTPENGIGIRHNVVQAVDADEIGEVAERLNAPVLKTGSPARGS
jgi:hypothetical protein